MTVPVPPSLDRLGMVASNTWRVATVNPFASPGDSWSCRDRLPQRVNDLYLIRCGWSASVPSRS